MRFINLQKIICVCAVVSLIFNCGCIRPTTLYGDVYQCPEELLNRIDKQMQEVSKQCQQQVMP